MYTWNIYTVLAVETAPNFRWFFSLLLDDVQAIFFLLESHQRAPIFTLAQYSIFAWDDQPFIDRLVLGDFA